MQALALAGRWTPGSNLRQVVVFRRGPDWRLMATMLDLRGALYARRPVPADDIWLNDSDIVLVPKTPIQQVDEVHRAVLHARRVQPRAARGDLEPRYGRLVAVSRFMPWQRPGQRCMPLDEATYCIGGCLVACAFLYAFQARLA